MDVEGGALKFEALMGTDKLIAASDEAKKRIQGMSHEFVNMGKEMDRSFRVATDSIEKSSVKRTGLIEKEEQRLKQLIEHQKKASSPESIATYNRLIADSKNKIAELNGVSNEQVATQSTLIGSLGKWALGLLTITGLIKGAKAVMESTSATAVILEGAIKGIESATSVLAKSIATLSFDNLIDRMRTAFRAGREYAREMEEIGNVEREYSIKRVTLQGEIEKLRLDIYAPESEVPVAEKIKKGDEMLAKMKEQANMEVEIATKKYEALASLEKRKTSLSEDELRFTIENFTKLKEIGEKASQWQYIVDQFDTAKAEGRAYESGAANVKPFKGANYYVEMTPDQVMSYRMALEGLGEDADMYGQIWDKYQGLNDKEKNLIADAIRSIGEANNRFYIESKRLHSMLGNMQEARTKQLEDEAKLKNQLTKQEELLEKAQEKGDQNQINAISERIAKLKEEIGLREKIAAQALLAAQIDTNLPMTTFNFPETGGADGKMTGRDYIPGMLGTTRGPGLVDATKAADRAIKQGEAYRKKTEKDQEDALKRQYEIRMRIVDAVLMETDVLAEKLGMESEALSRAERIVQQYASGDVIGGTINLLGWGLETVLTNTYTDAEFLNDQLNFAEDNLSKLDTLISHMDRTGIVEAYSHVGSLPAWGLPQKLKVDELTWQLKTLENAYDSLDRKRSTKKREEQLQEMQKEIIKTKDLLKDAEYAYQDFLLGGITEGTIADKIAQGFAEGKTSINDFAGYMNDVLKEAVLNIFKMQYLLPEINANFMPVLKKVMEDNIITKDEKAILDKAAKDVAIKAREVWEGLSGGLDFAKGSERSLQGAIKGVSEETAGIVAGQMNAMRISQAEISSYVREQLLQLSEIASNTRYLISIDSKLDTLNKNSMRAIGIT